ncbi:hypothetical protein BZG36_02518 [Bifiguratus adelaidae]|uniref:HMG box domain-containing protein n=1 Tax=Bifiguratus adelaidae TaxID=1938954 RepID=A0A261Y2T0_9FUNG|nr:hypothetical protein BZG36_02518 [Bifiguratus adelaidae]
MNYRRVHSQPEASQGSATTALVPGAQAYLYEGNMKAAMPAYGEIGWTYTQSNISAPSTPQHSVQRHSSAVYAPTVPGPRRNKSAPHFLPELTSYAPHSGYIPQAEYAGAHASQPPIMRQTLINSHGSYGMVSSGLAQYAVPTTLPSQSNMNPVYESETKPNSYLLQQRAGYVHPDVHYSMATYPQPAQLISFSSQRAFDTPLDRNSSFDDKCHTGEGAEAHFKPMSSIGQRARSMTVEHPQVKAARSRQLSLQDMNSGQALQRSPSMLSTAPDVQIPTNGLEASPNISSSTSSSSSSSSKQTKQSMNSFILFCAEQEQEHQQKAQPDTLSHFRNAFGQQRQKMAREDKKLWPPKPELVQPQQQQPQPSPQNDLREVKLSNSPSEVASRLSEEFSSQSPEPAAKASEKSEGDSSRKRRIKRPPNGYLLFNKDMRRTLLEQHPGRSVKEISKEIGNRWKSLSETVRQPYMDAARRLREKDLERHPNCIYARRSKLELAETGKHSKAGKKRLLDEDPVSEATPLQVSGVKDPRGRKKKKSKMEGTPKHPMSAYLYFTASVRPELLASQPRLTVADISRATSERWRTMDQISKAPWIRRAEKDKERYAREMELFTNGQLEDDEQDGSDEEDVNAVASVLSMINPPRPLERPIIADETPSIPVPV